MKQASFKEGRSKGVRKGLELGAMVGVHRCRSYLLMTPHGQLFLDTLVKGLPEAFLHSPDFWTRMQEPLSDWVADIVAECCKQLDIEGRATEVDTGKIIEIIERETPTLEQDPRVDD